ncbi:MAG: ribonuclease III [Chloroflexota bacterium]
MTNTSPWPEGLDWEGLEQALGVWFTDRGLLQQALVHRSYLNEHPGHASYERMEFLGDAFLGWVAAEALYQRHPDRDEGSLTRARASLVQGKALALIARRLGLGAYLALGAGEEAGGGRERPTNLAQALEAVLAAVLLDRGEEAARRVALAWLAEGLAHVGRSGAPRDAKSALQERLQSTGRGLPAYRLVSTEGPAHAREFTVDVLVDGAPAGRGTGARKADAEQAAAAQALEALSA